jgi:hypothetical protein
MMQTHGVTVTPDVPALAQLQQRALIIGALGLAGGLLGLFLNSDQFFRSWLVGFLFVLGLALGSLGLLMLQHLSGGQWGLVSRRIFEAASGTLPFVGLAFIPILFGMRPLFLWARPEAVQTDHILQVKAPYLNVPFFTVRAVLYFAFWILCMYLLNKWSAAQDRGETAVTPADTARFRTVSAPGLLFLVLTVTFASVDWMMSVDPHWFSTIFGLLTVVSQGLSALAFTIAVLAIVARSGVLGCVLAPGHFHDLGKLLLAFVMLWAYLSFSQFLIIWSGNLAEEIPWYIARIRGGWGLVAILLVLGHFALPFALLLSRDLKRHAGLLSKVAIFVVAMRLVDLIWLVAPSFGQHGAAGGAHGFSIPISWLNVVIEIPPIHWMDVVIPVGLTGLWFFVFAGRLRRRSLLPFNDPYYREAFAHESH